MRKILCIALALVMVLSLSACGEAPAQGVDTENHVITIGNTAATTGVMASFGVPNNYAINAHLWYYMNHTDGYKDADGNKYTIELKHYDDGFDAATGSAYTEKLVEEDMVFALVSHFGTGTVAATYEYLEEMGIPMVCAFTGTQQLYKTERNLFAIQPVYNAEGLTMLATALASEESGMGLGGKNIGVIATTDDAGKYMKEGIIEEAGKLKFENITYYDVDAAATDHTAAVEGLKAKGCDVVIIAANQFAYPNIAQQFVTSNYDNVDLMTSYVSANYGVQSGLAASGVITDTRKSYAASWIYTGSVPTETKSWKDFVHFVKIMTMYDKEMGGELVPDAFGYFTNEDWAKDGISSYYLNSYAMVGHIYANAFTQGLDRMNGKNLTWEAYIDAMESAPIDVPMGLTVDYANGVREGVKAMALLNFTAANPFGTQVRTLTDLPDIEAAIK